MKILLLSGEAEVIQAISLCLSLMFTQSEVMAASAANHAEWVESEAPDLVVLDLGTLESKALQAIQEIRVFSDVPILTLIGDDVMEGVRSLEAGPASFKMSSVC